MSPQGSDVQGVGTESCPWQTFDHSISQLIQGNTLLLLDGTYEPATTGLLQVTCGLQAVDGAAGAPITVAALNERQAKLVAGDAGIPIALAGCSYWTVRGLQAVVGDDPDLSDACDVYGQGDHLAFQRLALGPPDRYSESSVVQLDQCTSCLLEENEAYGFAFDGIELYESPQTILRRNYLNGQFWQLIDGGYAGIYNMAIRVEESDHVIVENNVVEGVNSGLGNYADALTDAGLASGNRYLGNIALEAPAASFGGAASAGFLLVNDCGGAPNATGLDCTAPDTSFINNLVLGGTVGFDFIDPVKSFFLNNTSVGCQVGFQTNPLADNSGVTDSCAILDDALVAGGEALQTFPTLPVSYIDTYATQTQFYNTTSNATDVSLPLNTNTCTVYLASGSALLTAGVDGGPIGASIVYEYDAGTLTAVPLWSDAGAFPCGVIVPGLNDTDGGNCRDVNTRIGIGTRTCPAP